ncbi:4930_t:CDS:2, partial [Gigaspora rosea]
HAKWLNMIEKRLELAKNLLKEDVVIFISIEEQEFANLYCVEMSSDVHTDFESMQLSSVASERAFSRAGFKVTNDRANLNENT